MAAYINDTELRVYIDQSDEMDQFEISMQPEKSVKSSKWAHAKFMKWQSSSVDLVNLKTSEPSDIAESLRAFYFSLQKENKELYPAVTLRGIRAGLHRFIVQAPYPCNQCPVVSAPHTVSAPQMPVFNNCHIQTINIYTSNHQ